MTKQKLLKEIDAVLSDAKTSEQSEQYNNEYFYYVKQEAFHRVRGGCQNIVRILGEAGKPWEPHFITKDHYLTTFQSMIGSLTSIRNAVDRDMLVKIEDLVLAEEFGNLLDQAEHLLKNGYFLAAGVLGRAVLEDHLRTWCHRAGCFPAKPKPTLNDFTQALYGGSHITKLVMKNIEALAAVGNDAAHNIPTLKDADVERLITELPTFLVNSPLP